MKKTIAVLSGKGGAGKTMISVNLAYVAKDAIYVDCDVEEPNGHLFLKPQIEREARVAVLIPQIDETKCNGCKKCVDFCKFNALAYVNRVKVFEDICHFCGGCTLVCPEGAITEIEKEIGKTSYGKSKDVTVMSGYLNIGSVTGVPIIEKLLTESDKRERLVVIDCPPGSACATMEAVKGADYCILVAEPTIFGAHNLDMVYRLVKLFNKPCGIVLNKCDGVFNPSLEYAKENNIDIISSIPYDSKISDINGNGGIIARDLPIYEKTFLDILEVVLEEGDGKL